MSISTVAACVKAASVKASHLYLGRSNISTAILHRFSYCCGRVNRNAAYFSSELFLCRSVHSEESQLISKSTDLPDNQFDPEGERRRVNHRRLPTRMRISQEEKERQDRFIATLSDSDRFGSLSESTNAQQQGDNPAHPRRHQEFRNHELALYNSNSSRHSSHARNKNRIEAKPNLNESSTLSDSYSAINHNKYGSPGSVNTSKSFSSRDVSSRSRRDDDLWCETFGTLQEEDDLDLDEKSFEDDLADKADTEDKPYRRLADEERPHVSAWYGRRIAKLGRAGKVWEAVDVLETQMLKVDRVMPSKYVFTVLIGVLGRVGYTKKAFQVFNQMKKFGLQPQDPTYTALFNACANSPWPTEDGLNRANNLRQLMRDKGYEPNLMTYRAMIKAYARGNDLQTAFSLVDEAIDAGLSLDADTYCLLLMACVSDKKAGLKHAIEVWRVMRRRKLKPTVFHYNLLLRCVRDCGLGDVTYAQGLVRSGDSAGQQLFATVEDSKKNSTSYPQRLLTAQSLTSEVIEGNESQPVDHILSDLTTSQAELESADKRQPHPINCSILSSGGVSVLDNNVPNLLNPRPDLRDAVGIALPTTAHGRLGLLGGVPGILSHMKRDGAAPNIKTFAELLDCIQPTATAEYDLMAAMTVHFIKPDIDFFSALIRRRNLHRDFKGARDVLELIDCNRLKPTQRTFGCLAMGCPNKQDGMKLIEDMKNCGLGVNVEVYEILIYQSNRDFSYKLALLQSMTEQQIRPTEKIIELLEIKVCQAKAFIIKKERGEDVPEYYKSDYFMKGYRHFMLRYMPWLQSAQLQPTVHPWAPHRQPRPDPSLAEAADIDCSDSIEVVKERKSKIISSRTVR